VSSTCTSKSPSTPTTMDKSKELPARTVPPVPSTPPRGRFQQTKLARFFTRFSRSLQNASANAPESEPSQKCVSVAGGSTDVVGRTNMCSCCNDLYLGRPYPKLENCKHKPDTCPGCFSAWIAAQIDSNAWDKIKCPCQYCNNRMSYADVREYASPETFSRYVL
jgi:hypothetical protein